MKLGPGVRFDVSEEELPGVRGQLIEWSPQNGWLVACVFPGESEPGVVAAVVVEPWFEMGRWRVADVAPVHDVPRPLAVVRIGDDEVLREFGDNIRRPAREGELELLGRPRMVSPVRLVKACKAYLGLIESTPDLEDLTAESNRIKHLLVNGE